MRDGESTGERGEEEREITEIGAYDRRKTEGRRDR